MYLVSTEWLVGNLSRVKIIDASWHLPWTNRDGFEEYKIEHIENSIFFDLDEFSEKILIFLICYQMLKVGQKISQSLA